MKLRFYFDSKPWSDSVSVYIVGEDAYGKKSIARPVQLVFEELDSRVAGQPTLEFSGHLSREFFPALAQGLAEAGYRAESNDAGELKATKLHLEDMRLLAKVPIVVKENR